MRKAVANDTYSVSSSEIAAFIEKKLKEFKTNPLINMNSLTYIGMVLTALGFIKNDNTLKILGDLLTDAPDKIRPLLSVRYTLVGTIGELQTALNKIAEQAFTELVEIVEDIAKAITSSSRDRLVELVGRLYDLLVVKLPAISITPGYPEEE